MSVLLDTQVWIWWLTGAGALPKGERAALDQAASSGGIRVSAISLWEAQLLHSRQRLELPLPFSDWLRRATNPEFITVLPLDLDVVLALNELPAAFHGDPADRLIVATARAHKLPLASHDRAIRRSRAVKVWTPAAALSR
ncbi:MAG: type II toxin-antitoxin system VapC family toxin [Vicinamibacterales bacterium]